MQDDLRQPLKRKTIRDRLRALTPSKLQLASTIAVVVGASAMGWAYMQDAPFAGEPVITMKIHPLEKIVTASTPKKKPTEPVEPENTIPPEPDPVDLAADRAIIYGQKVAIIDRPGMRTARPLRRAPVKAVSERGPFGLLPKKSRNGQTPFKVYSAKADHSLSRSSKPKIAVVISGMGINAKLTNQAIKELPGQITFAFAPYGRSIQPTINKARARGHEILLHLPMEPFGYPGVNPGPKTLLASAEVAENLKSLQWLMSRFSGYTGVTNYMGAKFTSDGGALLPVFSQIKNRGLVYFDDGSNDSSLTTSIAQAVNLSTRATDVVIDSDQTATSIQRALQRLEDTARRKGIAIGFGTGLSITIDTLESWSRTLSDRGIVLVPLSVAYRSGRS